MLTTLAYDSQTQFTHSLCIQQQSDAIETLEIILTCYNYICNADSNACGTKREPSPHPVPLTLGKQRQSMIHPYITGSRI